MITMKTKYALKALAVLARAEGDEPVLIGDIADQEGLPKKFLELILRERHFLGPPPQGARRRLPAAAAARGSDARADHPDPRRSHRPRALSEPDRVSALRGLRRRAHMRDSPGAQGGLPGAAPRARDDHARRPRSTGRDGRWSSQTRAQVLDLNQVVRLRLRPRPYERMLAAAHAPLHGLTVGGLKSSPISPALACGPGA